MVALVSNGAPGTGPMSNPGMVHARKMLVMLTGVKERTLIGPAARKKPHAKSNVSPSAPLTAPVRPAPMHKRALTTGFGPDVLRLKRVVWVKLHARDRLGIKIPNKPSNKAVFRAKIFINNCWSNDYKQMRSKPIPIFELSITHLSLKKSAIPLKQSHLQSISTSEDKQIFLSSHHSFCWIT